MFQIFSRQLFFRADLISRKNNKLGKRDHNLAACVNTAYVTPSVLIDDWMFISLQIMNHIPEEKSVNSICYIVNVNYLPWIVMDCAAVHCTIQMKPYINKDCI